MKVGPLFITDDNAEQILAYLKNGIPIMLEGPPGVGKSLAAREMGRLAYRQLAEECKERDDAVHRRVASVCSEGTAKEMSQWMEPLKIDITEDTEVRHLMGEIDYL